LGESDAAVAQVGPDPLVLDLVEPVLLQQARQLLLPAGPGVIRMGQKAVKQSLCLPRQLRPEAACRPELLQLRAARL